MLLLKRMTSGCPSAVTEAVFFRRLRYGGLLDIVMLDTRLYGRTGPVDSRFGRVAPRPAQDPTRSLLGEEQADWLERQLKSSGAVWKLVGQQVVFAEWRVPTRPGAPTNILNLDQWHAYPESRARLMNVLGSEAVENVVVLSGDVHSSWAHDLPADFGDYEPRSGRGSVGVEFVVPGLTSGGFPRTLGKLLREYAPANPHIKYAELRRRGYVLLDVTAERVSAEWRHFDFVGRKEPLASRSARRLATHVGRPWLVDGSGAAIGSF